MVVLIPALNEVATIADLVASVQRQVCPHVVVIDDCSVDGTGHAAMMAGAVVLSHTIRTGAWGAIRTGFRYALKHGYDIAVTMDGDGQHLPEHIKTILDPVRSKKTDVAIGSCLCRATVARQVAWHVFRKLSRVGIQDLTSGFRAYNQKAFSMLSSNETALLDYQDVGVLMLLKKKEITVLEIPVTMCHRVAGHSRIFSTWAAVFRYLLLTGILCFSKLR